MLPTLPEPFNNVRAKTHTDITTEPCTMWTEASTSQGLSPVAACDPCGLIDVPITVLQAWSCTCI